MLQEILIEKAEMIIETRRPVSQLAERSYGGSARSRG